MLFRDPSYEVMYDIYQQYKAENMGRMEHLVLTTMMHNVIGIGSALQKYPFMLEVMTTPHIPSPHGITQQLPVDVNFIVNLKRRDPIHLVVS
jgi:hypothetical protein